MKIYRIRLTTWISPTEQRNIEDTFDDWEKAETAYLQRASILTAHEDLQIESFELLHSIGGPVNKARKLIGIPKPT